MKGQTSKWSREPDPDTKGVTWITVNGIQFTVITSAAKKKFHIPDNEIVLSLGGGKYVQHTRLNRDELYKAAGYDVKKIDFGYPIGWARLPEIKKRIDKGDRPVWSYETVRHGAPVWDSEAKRKLKAIINRRLAARK